MSVSIARDAIFEVLMRLCSMLAFLGGAIYMLVVIAYCEWKSRR